MAFLVPVIAVFTKFDQFKRNVKMELWDEGHDPENLLQMEVESRFKNYYLACLHGTAPVVRLESEDYDFNWFMPIFHLCSVDMHKPYQQCTDLIEATANALSGATVTLMLIAVQRDNLELSIRQAIKW